MDMVAASSFSCFFSNVADPAGCCRFQQGPERREILVLLFKIDKNLGYCNKPK
jgi:hypothetical protein